MTSPNEQQMPLIAVFQLNEGFILDHRGYAIAVTSAEDLARRVGEIAGAATSVFQAPATVEEAVAQHLDREPQHSSVPSSVASPQEVAAALAPTSQDAVVPTAALETEWANARKMMAWMVAGFDGSGKAFTRKEFDAALPMFAPHLSPSEVEFEFGEFLSELQED